MLDSVTAVNDIDECFDYDETVESLSNSSNSSAGKEIPTKTPRQESSNRKSKWKKLTKYIVNSTLYLGERMSFGFAFL